MARRIRIAVSVFFGLSAVALCVLWVRSYWWSDGVSKVDASHVVTFVGFDSGNLHLVQTRVTDWQQHGWSYSGSAAAGMGFDDWHLQWPNLMILIPCWVLVGICFAGGIGPWITSRFSLRTLLAATTMVAVVLGIVMWAARRDFPVGSPRWWKKHRSQAVFHPGKGYKVPGVDGYFDGEGRPLESKSP